MHGQQNIKIFLTYVPVNSGASFVQTLSAIRYFALRCLFSQYHCLHLSISHRVSSFELRKNMTLDAKGILNKNGLLDIIGVFGIKGISKVRRITFHEGKEKE